MGSICSVFLSIVILLYTYQKLEVLILKKDVDVMSTV